MKIVIIGANGQLGMDLMQACQADQPVGLTHQDIEITSIDSVSRVLTAMKPDVVINTAAYHKVDDCEKYPDRAFQVNAIGAWNLATVAESLNSDIVHVSTDYVFDGAQHAPYAESDPPHPLNVYAVTKVAGEHLVAANSSRHYIVRSSGLYGHNTCRAKGRNFIDTMMAMAKDKKDIRVVTDEILTPTYTYHLARQIRELVNSHAYGFYHITNNGQCSWYDFACAIFKFAGMSVPVTPTTVTQFMSPIKRPHYSVLDNAALRKLGIDHMPDWQTSLKHYFDTKSNS